MKNEMSRWARYQYLPGTGLGKNGERITSSKEHINLSKEAATEGMVLLKNSKKVLPLKGGQRVALFGKGTFDYVKGGGGSGDVTVSYIRNIYEGLKELGTVCIEEKLAAFYKKYVDSQYELGKDPGLIAEPEIPADLLTGARAYTDTAIISISRFSGEAWDRKSSFDNNDGSKEVECGDLGPSSTGADIFEHGDFYLSDAEQAMVTAVTGAFDNVIVVLNVGGIVDTKWFKNNAKIQGVLLAWQGGMEGGLATAEILTGVKNPSGKLTDTFAENLEDYPSSETFHASEEYVEYTDDIFVGYRYFETIPGASKKVVYPFGYGLSYTEFDLGKAKIKEKDGKFTVSIKVTNEGDVAGKEVVQVYCEPARGQITKSKRVLVAFKKTALLQPGESRKITMEFDKYQFASYDDIGTVAKAAYVLEAGEYKFHVGTSVEDTKEAEYVYVVDADVVVEQLSTKLTPTCLTKRLLEDGTYDAVPTSQKFDTDANVLEPVPFEETEGMMPYVEPQRGWQMWNPAHKVITFNQVAEGRATLEDFMAQLTDRQLIHLLGGQPNTGVADTFGYGNILEYGIPSFMTADGPAGLRVRQGRGIVTTAWPCATLLACTFNEELIEAVGAAAGKEVKENNICFWLTPAINIHRSPLCGRNFEYYSEDPYVAGKLAGAMVRGVQSNRIGVSVKHFALNNKETNRKNSDSIVSERAAREIYLKAFEIIVKEENPWTIMSSYNIINGHRASENKELLEDILRGEWGFEGFVTTDWWTYGEHYKELLAGNDIKMGCGYPDRLEEALGKGAITREDLERSVKRLLNVLLRLE